MDRRTLLQRFAVVIGGSLVGADSLLAKSIHWENMDYDPDGPGGGKGVGIFEKKQIKLLNEIAETIIPATDTPGAKAAKVGAFMAVIVSDCYESKDQMRFTEGLLTLEDDCKKQTGKNFLRCTPAQRTEFLNALDKKQKEVAKSKKSDEPHHYFRTIKDMVIWGYFTSEIGATQALRFLEYPGKYTTVDYKKGERNWGGY